MIQIGDFSRLSRVSVRTLRHYETLGLMTPAYVDESSGYRYYELGQLTRMNRILAFRDVGFSLEQIKSLLDAGLSVADMRRTLLARRTQVHEQLKASEGQLSRIDAWLERIEKEESMSDYDVVIKRVEAQRVACVRGQLAAPAEQGMLWGRLFAHLKQQGITASGDCITVYHDDGPPEGDWDVEVCQPVSHYVVAADDTEVRELSAVESMACTVHHGPFLTIGDAYASLSRWIESNGYNVDGPAREVLLQAPAPEADPARQAQGIGADQSDGSTVVEVQFPVTRG